METAEKVRENRLRRMLARQGYQLSRTRRRDPRALDYGTYTVTGQDGAVVLGPCARGRARTLDDIEQWAVSGPGSKRGR